MMLSVAEAFAKTGIPLDLVDGDVRLLTSVPDVDLAVELGTLNGGTAAMLSFSCKRVVAIDLFEDVPDAFNQNYVKIHGVTAESVFEKLRPYKNVSLVKGDSAIIPPGVVKESVNLLFIDANHTYDGAKRDFLAWIPYMAPNCRVVFHDYGLGWKLGVKKFVDEEVYTDPRFAFWELGGQSVCFIFKPGVS